MKPKQLSNGFIFTRLNTSSFNVKNKISAPKIALIQRRLSLEMLFHKVFTAITFSNIQNL